MNHLDGIVHIGDLLTLGSVVIGLYLKSRSDQKHFQEIKDKANSQHAELQTKVNIMYTWFEGNVLNVKKGE